MLILGGLWGCGQKGDLYLPSPIALAPNEIKSEQQHALAVSGDVTVDQTTSKDIEKDKTKTEADESLPETDSE